MRFPDSPTYSYWKTFWFAAAAYWLFMFAEVADEVRHGDENLFIWVPTLLWLFVAALSVGAVQVLCHYFPDLGPRRNEGSGSNWPTINFFIGGLSLATMWGYSPLFSLCYDSLKWMLLIVLTSWLLGVGFKHGGMANVWAMLLLGWFSGVATMLIYIAIGPSLFHLETWPAAWLVGAFGVPFAVAVTLYDCTRTSSQ